MPQFDAQFNFSFVQSAARILKRLSTLFAIYIARSSPGD
jgi:hypothetical protein